MKSWLVAHRGASYFEKENTLAAIKRAAQFDAGYIEIDIRVTKDNVAVLFHDASLENQKISKTNYGDLKKLDNDLLTLRELDEAITNEKFFVELKSKKSAHFVAPFLLKHTESFACSFLPGALLELSKNGVDTSRLYLAQHGYPIKIIENAQKYGFGGISMSKWFLAPWSYYRIKKRGINLFVYTVNNKTWARLLHSLSEDIKICSDRIDNLKELK